jgi:hypothetical protein
MFSITIVMVLSGSAWMLSELVSSTKTTIKNWIHFTKMKFDFSSF